MTIIAMFTANGYTATLYRNDKTGKYGYTILTTQGDVYAQGKGRKTESDAREECLFELQHAI